MILGNVIAGRFEIEHLAGQGGMGTVYRARDRADGGAIALKVLKEGGHADAERFGREATALSELHHPGIVRYVSHGLTPEGRPFLAMEWLDGEDLNQRLARGPLETAECVELGRRVGDALSVAHGRGIVHRDVKPSNLFLPGGRVADVKVVDFGVVRMLGWSPGPRTRPGMVIGTPGYMAPEQARGDDVIDARADVFALGCVLYECLTGQVAFPGEHVMAVLAKILFREVPSIRETRPDVPDALEALVLAMMRKQADARPAGGAEVAAAFGRLDARGVVRSSSTQAPEPRVITGGALRLVSLVLAEGVPSADPFAPLASDAPTTADLGGAVAAYGGVAQPLATGGLVITFSGEGTATDLAQQAARCALDLSALAPGARIAVATGLGDLSGQGVVGEAIDRGVRLLHDSREASAPSVLLDDVTAGLLGPRFQRTAGGALVRERPIEEAATVLLGRPTPCVGRKRELAALLGIFESCVGEPESRAVVVTGAPGGGKSRLREELTRTVCDRWPDAQILLGCGERTRRGARLAILADAVRRMIRLREGDPLVLQRKVLAASVASRVPAESAKVVTEFLGELVGVPFPDEDSVRLRAARADAQLMSDQLERAWLDLLGAECDRHPVLLALEDLQWADVPTLRFVDVALRTLHDRPLCVLALARPEIDAIASNLWATRRVDRVALPALGGKASAELVRSVLGDEVPAGDVARIVERAGGNALFLEQLIRAHAEGSGDAPPASVLAMLQARLDALGVEQKRVLRAASVFGRTFWREGVRVLLGELAPEPALGRWLAELADRGFVARPRTDHTPGQEEWAFRHDLQRDAAYASLPDDERVLGHRLAGEWLERGGARGALAIAEHFELGGERARAVHGFVEAAEAALQANDLEAARAHAERAVACGATGETLGAVRALESEVSRWQGDNARGVVEGREAVRLLPRGAVRWYLAVGQLASLLGRAGETEALTELGEGLLEPPPPDAGGAWVVAAARAAISLLFAGRYTLGDTLLRAIETVAAGTGEPDASVAAWFHLARATRAQFDGDVSALAAEEEAAARAYQAVGNRRCAWEERAHAGFAYMLLGAYDRAVAILLEAARESERLGLAPLRANALHNLGLALALNGQLAEGLAAEREAIRVHSGGHYARGLGACRLYAARILLLRGDLEEALAEARMAAEMLAAYGPALAVAHAVLSSVHLAQGAVHEALEQAEKGHTLAGLGVLEEGDAFVRLAYAEALRAAGDEQAARRVLEEARRRVLETAAKIGDPELRDGFLRRVAENARVLALTDRRE
jgi:tetratricopeptide (TPR) repeat protein